MVVGRELLELLLLTCELLDDDVLEEELLVEDDVLEEELLLVVLAALLLEDDVLLAMLLVELGKLLLLEDELLLICGVEDSLLLKMVISSMRIQRFVKLGSMTETAVR